MNLLVGLFPILYLAVVALLIIIPIIFYKQGNYKACSVISVFAIIIGLLHHHILFSLAFGVNAKPIIYLYPKQEQNVTVKLMNKGIITVSYPKYEDEWKVLAKPNGDLVDLKTGRNLYALYWEGSKLMNVNFNEGFVVKGEDAANFLEEKLAILGLNEREAEEFIVYWLPKLENNKYNFIRFATEMEINTIMPLQVDPKPDTMIRVYMQFKGVNKNYKCREQLLEAKERNGFTLVEWGGIQL